MAEASDERRARSDMLHREAQLGLEKALDHGPKWTGFKDQIAIANHCYDLALTLDAEIAGSGDEPARRPAKTRRHHGSR